MPLQNQKLKLKSSLNAKAEKRLRPSHRLQTKLNPYYQYLPYLQPHMRMMFQLSKRSQVLPLNRKVQKHLCHLHQLLSDQPLSLPIQLETTPFVAEATACCHLEAADPSTLSMATQSRPSSQRQRLPSELQSNPKEPELWERQRGQRPCVHLPL